MGDQEVLQGKGSFKVVCAIFQWKDIHLSERLQRHTSRPVNQISCVTAMHSLHDDALV